MSALRHALKYTHRGVALIEFALALVLLLMMTAGVTELGRAFWHFSAIQKATRDAARCIADDPTREASCLGDAALAIEQAGVSPSIGAFTVTDTGNDEVKGLQEYVTVTATHPVTWLWGLGGALSAGEGVTFTLSTTMPYMQAKVAK